MSHDEKVGEVVSAIISLVNNQYSCLVELLGHRQPTEILENFSWHFNFRQSAKIFFVLVFFKSHFFTILLTLFFHKFHVDLFYLAWIYWFDRKVNMYDIINNLYNLIVSLQMETGNVPDRSNISVSIGLQNEMDRYGTDQKATRYNGNIVYGLLCYCRGWYKAYLFEQRLFQNKIYYWDKIYFYFAKIKLSKHTLYKLNWLPDYCKIVGFMHHNIKMQHVLGWSIKKCGSFLEYVVLLSKTVDYIFSK